MCWEINKKKFNKKPEKYRKVAKKDIEVYKIGFEEDNGFSPYYRQDFIYKANSLNDEISLHMDSRHDECYCIDEGYHSYSGECGIINSFYDIGVYSKNDNEKQFDFYQCDTIGKFIIPKGTEYYENEDGEIVSSNIIWTGKIKYITDIKTSTEIKLKDLNICIGV